MNILDIRSGTADRTGNKERIVYEVKAALQEAVKSSEDVENGKVLEDRDIGGHMSGYTEAQKELADRAQEIIMSNLERRITIAELAQALHVSATQVKVSFHKVTGAPIYAYARSQRMEAASRLLAETDESILEIAGKVGYENGSKFAKAFRMVKGVSPCEYRRRILWEKENRA